MFLANKLIFSERVLANNLFLLRNRAATKVTPSLQVKMKMKKIKNKLDSVEICKENLSLSAMLQFQRLHFTSNKVLLNSFFLGGGLRESKIH